MLLQYVHVITVYTCYYTCYYTVCTCYYTVCTCYYTVCTCYYDNYCTYISSHSLYIIITHDLINESTFLMADLTSSPLPTANPMHICNNENYNCWK